MDGHNSFAGQWPAMYNRKAREQKADQIIKILKDYLGKNKLKTLTLLDVGSSTGIIDNKLAPKFRKILGVDTDEEAVLYAQNNFKRGNLSFAVQDAMKLKLSTNSFDIVVCTQVYEHVPDPVKLFSEINRVLKPGGVCYLAALNKFWPLEPHYKLLFLSYLPESLGNFYLKLMGKGEVYDEHLESYWGLRKLTKSFLCTDYTDKIIKNPKRFGYEGILKYPVPLIYPLALFYPILKYFVPTYFWILEKKIKA